MLWLFDTCGFIVGPAIWAAGLIAVAVCLRASGAAAPSRRRRARVAAVTPAAVGLTGAAFGLIVWWADGGRGEPWAAPGKVCLAGIATAAVPLVWSLLLLRPRPGPGIPAAA